MTSIVVSVHGAALSVKVEGTLTSGMVGVPVRFAFDEAWEGLTKTAVFRAGGVSIDRVDIGEETTVPWEVMQKKNCTLQIGVYGCSADGTLVMPTVCELAGIIQPGADPSGDASTDPSLPVWQQTLQKATAAEEAAKASAAAAEKVRTAYENGELNGKEGNPGKSAYEIAAENGFEGTEAEWVEAMQEVFVAEYGVTAFAEMEEACKAGKVVFCRVGTNYVLPMYKYEAGDSMIFYRITKDIIINYYCTKENGWASKDLQYAANTQITGLQEQIAVLQGRIAALEKQEV